MYKNKIKVSCLLFLIAILAFLCFQKFIQLNELKDKKEILAEKVKSINELADTVRKISFDNLKSGDKIFNNNMDHKNIIGEIARRFSINKVFFRTEDKVPDVEKIVEIKFSLSKEDQIYKFIDTLWRESGGIIKFESIKIGKFHENELSVKMKCTITSVDKNQDRNSIELIEKKRKYDIKSINLFGVEELKMHRLFCIINNSRAYVDDSWYGVGDQINDSRVVNIHQNFIEIQSDNKKSVVQLGASW